MDSGCTGATVRIRVSLLEVIAVYNSLGGGEGDEERIHGGGVIHIYCFKSRQRLLPVPTPLLTVATKASRARDKTIHLNLEFSKFDSTLDISLDNIRTGELKVSKPSETASKILTETLSESPRRG